MFSTIDATTRKVYWEPMINNPLIEGVLLSKAKIDDQIDALAYHLNEEYAGKKVTVVPVMLGGMIFCSDLVRKLSWMSSLIRCQSIVIGGQSPPGRLRCSWSRKNL